MFAKQLVANTKHHGHAEAEAELMGQVLYVSVVGGGHIRKRWVENPATRLQPFGVPGLRPRFRALFASTYSGS